MNIHFGYPHFRKPPHTSSHSNPWAPLLLRSLASANRHGSVGSFTQLFLVNVIAWHRDSRGPRSKSQVLWGLLPIRPSEHLAVMDLGTVLLRNLCLPCYTRRPFMGNPFDPLPALALVELTKRSNTNLQSRQFPLNSPPSHHDYNILGRRCRILPAGVDFFLPLRQVVTSSPTYKSAPFRTRISFAILSFDRRLHQSENQFQRSRDVQLPSWHVGHPISALKIQVAEGHSKNTVRTQ